MRNMRKVLLGFFLLVLVGVGAVVYGMGPWRTAKAPAPHPAQRVPLFPTPLPTPTPSPTPPATPTRAPIPTPLLGSPTPTLTPVLPRLEVHILDISGSGFTRRVTARLVNTGNGAATGVYTLAEFFAGDTRVKVNGQNALRIDIGRVETGQTIQREVEIGFSLLDGLRLQRSGGRAVLTVYADQGTWRFEETFRP